MSACCTLGARILGEMLEVACVSANLLGQATHAAVRITIHAATVTAVTLVRSVCGPRFRIIILYIFTTLSSKATLNKDGIIR